MFAETIEKEMKEITDVNMKKTNHALANIREDMRKFKELMSNI